MQNPINTTLQDMDVYASKAISLQAKANPNVANLSFGEPEFGPPKHLLDRIVSDGLNVNRFLDSVKRYEDPRGSLALRQAIANWYKRRYDLEVNPETEIMVTHGGVESIALSILCTSEADDFIATTDPSYMLYNRAIKSLGRRVISLSRPIAEYEYSELLNNNQINFDQCKAMIINSPENPSGYVLGKGEWEEVSRFAQKNNIWIIHDEVYDTMTFKRPHIPAKKIKGLEDRTILINSFSKKFGMPGLRIGWMVANKELINIASKAHDYLYLGVNIQYEEIARMLLDDLQSEAWLRENTTMLQKRMELALNELGSEQGINWTRQPLGAMFLFPNVKTLYQKIPEKYKFEKATIGEAVANYLIQEKNVAVVPGSVYGSGSSEFIRMVLCSTEKVFLSALNNLKSLSEVTSGV